MSSEPSYVEELINSIREHQADVEPALEALREISPDVSEMITDIQNKHKELVCLLVEQTRADDQD